MPKIRTATVTAARLEVGLLAALAALAALACAQALASDPVLEGFDLKIESIAASADAKRHSDPATLFTRLQGFAVDAQDQPHVLVSQSRDRFGSGPHDLLVVRAAARPDGSPDVVRLISVQGLADFIAFGIGANEGYALALGTSEGTQLRLFDSAGTLIEDSEQQMPNEVPVAVLPEFEGGFILVTNSALYAISETGAVEQRSGVEPDQLIAAAARLPGLQCGLVTIIVDSALRATELERRCGPAQQFRRDQTIKLPAQLGVHTRSTLVAMEASQVAFASPPKNPRESWTVATCSLQGARGCTSARVDVAPSLPSLSYGLSLAPIGNRLIAARTSEAGDQLTFTVVAGRKGGSGRLGLGRSQTFRLPTHVDGGQGVAERVIVLPAREGLWLALGYWTYNGSWSHAQAPTELSTVVAVKRLTTLR